MPEFEDLTAGDKVVRTIVTHPFKDPIVNASPSWKALKTKMEYWLQDYVGLYPVDEVALMFTDKEKLFEFIDAAVREPGVKLFNAADDHVRTQPISSEYWVSYYFLEVEDLGMRVEVMYIERGSSPLHDTLSPWNSNPTISGSLHEDSPVVVHFSFKVPRSKYEETRAAMVSGGATLAQSCESDYGRFSYYRHPEFGENTYIKPRVNLRDPEPHLDEPLPNTTDAGDRGNFGFPGVGKAGRPVTDSPQA